MECREFLASIGQEHTKVGGLGARRLRCRRVRTAACAPSRALRGAVLCMDGRPPVPAVGNRCSPYSRRSCTSPRPPVSLTTTTPPPHHHYLHPTHPPTLTPLRACQVIAKCETRQSLFNFRNLVDAADAIIISRGNLGLDVVRGLLRRRRHCRRCRRCCRRRCCRCCCRRRCCRRGSAPLGSLQGAWLSRGGSRRTCPPATPSLYAEGAGEDGYNSEGHDPSLKCFNLFYQWFQQVPEKMAMIQKAMISTCAILGKPSIITRVVDTMIRTPRPTR